jgi:hypothetical protein
MLSEALQRNAKHEARLSNISDLLLRDGYPKVNPRFFSRDCEIRMTNGSNDVAFDLAQKLTRFRERLVNLAGVFPSALRAFMTSATFSANDWRDLLNQFARLKFGGQR